MSCEREPGFSGSEIELLRRPRLKEQRRLNEKVTCCDYDAAEDAVDRGIDGCPKYGGGHLCNECLGLEVVEE